MTDSDSEDEQPDPTPLVQRLRSRTRSSHIEETTSEVDADAESEADPSEASPRPSRSLRSRDKTESTDSIVIDQPSRRSSRSLPARGAKRKAIEALKGGESEPEAMDLDEGVLEDSPDEMEEDKAPRSGPLTRSQLRAQADEAEIDEEQSSEDENANTTRERMSTSLTPLSSEQGMDEDEPDTVEDEPERQTRSGKTFGTLQNRKNRLRQEALDDPDMEVDEDTDEDEDDESFEPGKWNLAHVEYSLCADVDLSGATLPSLIRLLRDELVQLCESRGIEVGGTKPQLAQALLDWASGFSQACGSSANVLARRAEHGC